MRLRYLAPLAMAAAAATIGLAPVAAAAPTGPCTTTGKLDRVRAARPCQYHQLAAGGFRPAAPISPISVVPHTLWTLSMR